MYVHKLNILTLLTIAPPRNPNYETLVPALYALLSSQDPDDAISEQMAELLGFEHLDLVMDLLASRDVAKRTVRSLNFFSLQITEHA